jgi:hypothetical protein
MLKKISVYLFVFLLLGEYIGQYVFPITDIYQKTYFFLFLFEYVKVNEITPLGDQYEKSNHCGR